MTHQNSSPALGIDIGGSSVKAALIIGDERFVSISPEYARPERDELADAVRAAVAGLPDQAMRAERVGLCVPGIRAADGRSIELSYNVPGLVGYPFAEIVRDGLGRGAGHAVLSDALAGTLDAAAAAPEAERVLGIAMGTGVGAALIDRGVPSGATERFGQMDIGPIGDDAHRTLESVVGLPVLRERFGSALRDHIGALPETDPVMIALSRAIRSGVDEHAPDAVILLGGIGIGMAGNAELLAGMSGLASGRCRLLFGSSRHHAAFGAARYAAE